MRGEIDFYLDFQTTWVEELRILNQNKVGRPFGDQEEFIPLVKNALEQGLEIKQVQGDGIFDTKEIHNFLAQQKLEPGIPPRKNASRKARGSAARAEEIRLYQDYGEQVWKLIRQYHLRPAVERTFSAFKQLFGDTVMSRRWDRIEDEIKSKFWILNWNLTRHLIAESHRSNS